MSQEAAHSRQHTAKDAVTALELLRAEAEKIVAKYEERRAAMLPVLHLVQRELGIGA